MKKSPALVVMAAGMGSRYGGLKQIDPIDPQGHLIIDFSLFDARRAGFETVVFLIKPEIEKDFREVIGNRMERYMNVKYAYQRTENIPEGFSVPAERKKPWGTGHAVLSCSDQIDGPFAVINADVYYGPKAYQMLYDRLLSQGDDEKYRYAMVGYVLENTLTENGHVARGVCVTDERGRLTEIHERTHIEKKPDGAYYTEDGGDTWVKLPERSIVSMNLWGFTPSILGELRNRFPRFLEENLPKDPLKCEYFLPTVVNQLVSEGKASVDVLRSEDRWYGVTYHEDKAFVEQAIRELKAKGVYPQELWEK